jgi:hypothetical protein
MTGHITQDPDPVKPGQKVTFTFNIDGISLPVTLTGTWDPGGQAFEHTVTGSGDNSWTETVPADAEGGDIEDSSGQTGAFAIMVAP